MKTRNTSPQAYRPELVDAPPPWRSHRPTGAASGGKTEEEDTPLASLEKAGSALRDEELMGWEQDVDAESAEAAPALGSLDAAVAAGARTWLQSPRFPPHPTGPAYPARQRALWLVAVIERLRESTNFVDGTLVERGRPPRRAWDVSAPRLPAYLAFAVDVRQNDFAFPREVYVRAARLVTIWRNKDAATAIFGDPVIDLAIRQERKE